MSPTLWGQLPFDLLSKILKIEKDRLDEVAMNEWKHSIKDLNHEFKGVCWEAWLEGEYYCCRNPEALRHTRRGLFWSGAGE
jgi:hypothetical protein